MTYPRLPTARGNLLRELVIRDLKVRYASPFLGFLWAFLYPFAQALILYFIFAVLFRVPLGETDYLLYLLTGVFSWRFFQESITVSTTSLVDNRFLLKESGFEQYLIPVSVVLAQAVIFVPSLLVIIACALVILHGLPACVLALPAVVGLHVALTMSLAVVVSVLYARWRDIRYLVDILLLALFYLSPVFYSVSYIRDRAAPDLFIAYIANPCAGVLYLYRCALLKGFSAPDTPAPVAAVSVSSCIVFTLLCALWASVLYRRTRASLTDYLTC